jgi:hypothetical protein
MARKYHVTCVSYIKNNVDCSAQDWIQKLLELHAVLMIYYRYSRIYRSSLHAHKDGVCSCCTQTDIHGSPPGRVLSVVVISAFRNIYRLTLQLMIQDNIEENPQA